MKNKELIGKIFVSSWGYDQTNIDYFIVKDVTPSGASVKIQRLGNKRVETLNSMSEHVVPNVDVVRGEVMTKRLSPFRDTFCLKINSFASAFVWDGKPLYQSHYH